MKSLLLTISLILSVATASAEANNCSIKLQGGGVDNWPWLVAQPWKNIQGIWKLNSDIGEIYFKFRITGAVNKGKILLIDKIENGNCANPIAKGVGYISTEERNIIRAVVSDAKLRYQMKLAVFDTQDLTNQIIQSDAKSCGQQVIGISVQEVIGRTGKQVIYPNNEYLNSENDSMMLKKVSDSLDSICKKPTGH